MLADLRLPGRRSVRNEEVSLTTTLITNLLTNQCAQRRTCRHIRVNFSRSKRANHGTPLSMALEVVRGSSP
jgi:hypothetical protein